jgi:predicted nucleic acid-binding protein
VQRHELDADAATGIVSRLPQIPATRHRHSDLLEAAFAFAVELSITMYDALYVSLAAALDAPLITSERWLAERASSAVDVRSP